MTNKTPPPHGGTLEDDTMREMNREEVLNVVNMVVTTGNTNLLASVAADLKRQRDAGSLSEDDWDVLDKLVRLRWSSLQ